MKIVYDEIYSLLRDPYFSFTIPLFQCIVTGFFCFFAAWSLAWYMEFTRALALALVFLSVIPAGIWLYWTWRWLNAMALLSRSAGMQMEMEESPDQNVTVWMPAEKEGPYLHRTRADLPASTEQLQRLGTGIVAGKSFTESAWVGSTNVFNREQFVAIRDEMVHRHMAEWVSIDSPARGVRITAQGMAAMRFFAQAASPTPQLVDL